VKDYVSREIFEDILDSEEEHIDWLETQLGLIASPATRARLFPAVNRKPRLAFC
jgi:bacterioferritin (cytochrome b1)